MTVARLVFCDLIFIHLPELSGIHHISFYIGLLSGLNLKIGKLDVFKNRNEGD